MATIETALISFFSIRGVKLTPIPTESQSGQRTPDFVVNYPQLEAILELKEIETNDEEAIQISLVERGKVGSIDHSNDVARFVAKIRDANRQLKQKCAGRPGITVIADTRSFFAQALTPQRILAEAMFGRETLWVTMPQPTVQCTHEVVAHDFGRGRSLGPNANTTTSAIALFVEKADGSHTLLIHHNPNAAAPLPRGLLCDHSVREFIIPTTRAFSGFKEITPK